METKIFSVFPACGKTWVFNHQEDLGLKILDSDSSEFSWKLEGIKDRQGNLLRGLQKVRNPEFSNNYIKHIKENIGKYDCIFVSTHASVREALDKEGIDYTIVYPKVGCKAEWIGRCFIREQNKESGCDAENMYINWEDWILECVKTGLTHKEIVLDSKEYLSKYF